MGFTLKIKMTQTMPETHTSPNDTTIVNCGDYPPREVPVYRRFDCLGHEWAVTPKLFNHSYADIEYMVTHVETGLSASGEDYPSAEEAERGVRCYLQSLGADRVNAVVSDYEPIENGVPCPRCDGTGRLHAIPHNPD